MSRMNQESQTTPENIFNSPDLSIPGGEKHSIGVGAAVGMAIGGVVLCGLGFVAGIQVGGSNNSSMGNQAGGPPGMSQSQGGPGSYRQQDNTVSTGNSPGKITVLNSFSISETGVYKAEILNKDHYDQIVAQDVYIDAQSKLDLTYLAGGVIKKGDTFTIVNNNGTNPVQGTFKDLPEGAEVTVSGATFKISYVGGDGNDVVLTAQNDSKAPKAPNTGGEKLSVNLIGAIAGVSSAAALLFVTKRKSLSKK